MAASPAFTTLRVVELADDPAGEFAGKLLADLGADVVKVEPAGGAPSRHVGPYAAHRDGDVDASLTFWTYNTSKRSAVLDVSARDDLIDTADVLLTTWTPSQL